jgi:dTDP-4-dehydrorhamnose reductase
MDKIKVLLTGGSGTLGKELIKIFDHKKYSVYYPNSSEVNICDFITMREWFRNYKPNLVIHCAAFTNVKESEQNYIKSIETNIIGTCNIIKCCEEQNIKLIFISTDYVFDGEKGNYSKEDLINPLTNYAKSKAAAELAVRMYKNSLIIRTSFFGYTFPYENAIIDQWTTKDYIDVIAPKILDLSLSEKIGIEHCFSKKRTIFEIAKIRNNEVKPIKRKDLNLKIPADTSLI